jgi:hypothetical protein
LVNVFIHYNEFHWRHHIFDALWQKSNIIFDSKPFIQSLVQSHALLTLIVNPMRRFQHKCGPKCCNSWASNAYISGTWPSTTKLTIWYINILPSMFHRSYMSICLYIELYDKYLKYLVLDILIVYISFFILCQLKFNELCGNLCPICWHPKNSIRTFLVQDSCNQNYNQYSLHLKITHIITYF